ncbi:hypothetical protein JCM10908_006617 [Rhodotorula pacifica]|uniref:uncharacterized protein n=1 Tax=Rhodotorula pacifica TaxID=1495444 RepID=UPI00316E5B4B
MTDWYQPTDGFHPAMHFASPAVSTIPRIHASSANTSLPPSSDGRLISYRRRVNAAAQTAFERIDELYNAHVWEAEKRADAAKTAADAWVQKVAEPAYLARVAEADSVALKGALGELQRRVGKLELDKPLHWSIPSCQPHPGARRDPHPPVTKPMTERVFRGHVQRIKFAAHARIPRLLAKVKRKAATRKEYLTNKATEWRNEMLVSESEDLYLRHRNFADENLHLFVENLPQMTLFGRWLWPVSAMFDRNITVIKPTEPATTSTTDSPAPAQAPQPKHRRNLVHPPTPISPVLSSSTPVSATLSRGFDRDNFSPSAVHVPAPDIYAHSALERTAAPWHYPDLGNPNLWHPGAADLYEPFDLASSSSFHPPHAYADAPPSFVGFGLPAHLARVTHPFAEHPFPYIDQHVNYPSYSFAPHPVWNTHANPTVFTPDNRHDWPDLQPVLRTPPR